MSAKATNRKREDQRIRWHCDACLNRGTVTIPGELKMREAIEVLLAKTLAQHGPECSPVNVRLENLRFDSAHDRIEAT